MKLTTRSVLYWILTALFAVGTVIGFSESNWLRSMNMVCLTLTFVLMALHARYQIRVILWAVWVVMALGISSLLLDVAIRHGLVDLTL